MEKHISNKVFILAASTIFAGQAALTVADIFAFLTLFIIHRSKAVFFANLRKGIFHSIIGEYGTGTTKWIRL